MESIAPSQAVAVNERTHVSEARRAAGRLAQSLGFSEEAEGRLSLVVTELGTNLVKHAGGGQIVISPVRWDEGLAVEVYSLDRGPGMRNVSECMRDGYSTAGSPGTGLGAIKRMAHSAGLYSAPEQGTVARALCTSGWQPNKSQPWDFAGILLAYPGEAVSGDGWAARAVPGGAEIFVVDGLGHGLHASDAARQAEQVFWSQSNWGGPELMEALSRALRSTRGAVAGFARIITGQQEVAFTGIGNIAGAIVTGNRVQAVVSMNGILGQRSERIRDFRYSWTEDSLLVLHSDGIKTKWKLEQYPGVTAEAGLSAGILLRDAIRGNDDATVVVARRGNGHA